MLCLRNLTSRNLGNRTVMILSSKMNYSDKSDRQGKEGSIREEKGAFAKKGAFEEDDYFRKLQREQLEKLKDEVEVQIAMHKEEIKHHENAIKKAKMRVEEMERKENK